VTTGVSTHVTGLFAADVSDLAIGLILGLCILVMLMPFAGVAVVVRDVVREHQAARRRAGADGDSHRKQR